MVSSATLGKGSTSKLRRMRLMFVLVLHQWDFANIGHMIKVAYNVMPFFNKYHLFHMCMHFTYNLIIAFSSMCRSNTILSDN